MNFYPISAVAALGGLLFGYDAGVISGALLFIPQMMALPPTLQGVLAGHGRMKDAGWSCANCAARPTYRMS